MPLETVSALSGRLWRLVAPLLKRHQRALDNLALAYPQMSTDERRRVGKRRHDQDGCGPAGCHSETQARSRAQGDCVTDIGERAADRPKLIRAGSVLLPDSASGPKR